MAISRLVMEFIAADGLSGAARRMAGEVRALGASGQRAAAQLEEVGERFAQGIKAAGIARELKTSLVDPGLAAAAEMEAALKRLEASVDSRGAKEMAEFLAAARKDADAIGAATKFDSAGVLRDAVTEQIKAGLRPEDVLGMRGGAAAAAFLAQADDSDIATANQVILDGASKFGLAGEEITRFADSVIRFSGASSASAASLDEGLKYLTGLRDIGIGAEDTLALLATLDLQGLRGSTGGTSLNQFLSKMTEADQKVTQLDFYDAAGQFRGIDEMTAQLRQYFGGMTSEQQQLTADKLFGDEGKRVLFALLQQNGDTSLEGVRAAAERARGLEERMAILGSGNLASRDALAGTTRSTLARLFEPLLAPTTGLAQGLNEAVAKVGDAAAEDPRIAQGVSGAAGSAVVGAGAYALYQFTRGGMAGLSALKSLRGVPGAGLLGGMAAGKAVEAAAGVAPVFVTNWPAGGMLGGGEAGAVVAGAGGKVGALGKAVGAVGALAGGYAVGTVINDEVIQGSGIDTYIQGMMGALVNNAVGRRVFDEETVQGAAMAQSDLLTAVAKGLNLGITVVVQPDGTAKVITDGVDNVSVAARRSGGGL